MLMILARLVRSESFWEVVKVRSPHTGPEVCYIILYSSTALYTLHPLHPPSATEVLLPRDPSIVSPSLAGVFIGHNKHGTGSRCTLQKHCRSSVVPPLHQSSHTH